MIISGPIGQLAYCFMPYLSHAYTSKCIIGGIVLLVVLGGSGACYARRFLLQLKLVCMLSFQVESCVRFGVQIRFVVVCVSITLPFFRWMLHGN